MGYNADCQGCPYFNQTHLDSNEWTNRHDPPVEAETNGSSVLIVALAPGVDEWLHGSPLMPCKRTGGTGGRRVQRSWVRKGKVREDFDIIEAVQCYPGVGSNGRDKKPSKQAVTACAGRLRARLKLGKYQRAVALGKDAYESLKQASADMNLKIVEGPHPNGGAKNHVLDALW